MMFQNHTIPPQPGMPFKRNHRFPDLEKMNIHIPATAMPLPGAGNAAKRRIFLNSFDASVTLPIESFILNLTCILQGGNSCLLLEEAPIKHSKATDPRNHHVLTFSARTPFSLRAIKEKYLQYIRVNPNTSLADLAYTTTARRMHQSSTRSTFTSTSIEDFVNKLETDLKKEDAPVKKGRGASTVPSVVFAFTGQGSQYAGMAHQLWRDSTVFRRLIESIQSIATALELPKFIDLIDSENFDLSEASPVQTQLAIIAVEIGLAQLWASWGVRPSLVIGHSLGEYAALCISGVLTVSDTLYLVGKRAMILVQSVAQNEYAMLAINDDVGVIRQLLASHTYDTCEIACINAPKSTVVSGALSEITVLQKELEEQGSRSTLLHVPFGFHSKQMDPILNSYESCVKGVGISSPRVPIASTLLGDIIEDKSIISPIYLRRQTRESVDFVGALRAAQNSNYLREDTLFLEMGPDPVCMSLIRSILGTSATPRLLPGLRRNEDNWLTTSNTLAAVHQAGVPVNWPEYHREFKNCLSLLDLPTYVFDEKDFWTSYPDPEQLGGVEQKHMSSSPVPAVQGFPTTTLQRVTNETFDDGSISVTFESSTSDPHLFDAIMGHAVAGVTICSSSIFSDMALSAARYACERLQPGNGRKSYLQSAV
jgi:acyl transferase domain-containing protein